VERTLQHTVSSTVTFIKLKEAVGKLHNMLLLVEDNMNLHNLTQELRWPTRYKLIYYEY